MEYSTTKRFNKRISKIGFGAWQLGNNQEFEEMSVEEGLSLVQKAVEEGITLFDTAPNYAQGRSEEILGRALKGTEDEVFINTKVGHDKQDRIDFSLDTISRSVQNSLKALNREFIDSVILHNPELEVLQGKTGHYKFLEDLKSQGLINGYGVSIDTPDELEAVLNNSDVDVIELLFNINHQSPKKWFHVIKERDILLMIKVPLDSGWLTGKYDKNTNFTGIRSRWTKEVIATRSKIIDSIKTIVKKDDLVPVALSFILSFDAVTSVIPGTRNEYQLKSNIDSLNFNLPEQMKVELEELYDTQIASLHTPW